MIWLLGICAYAVNTQAVHGASMVTPSVAFHQFRCAAGHMAINICVLEVSYGKSRTQDGLNEGVKTAYYHDAGEGNCCAVCVNAGHAGALYDVASIAQSLPGQGQIGLHIWQHCPEIHCLHVQHLSMSFNYSSFTPLT